MKRKKFWVSVVFAMLLCAFTLGFSACFGGEEEKHPPQPQPTGVLVTYYETQENHNAKSVYATDGVLRLNELPLRTGYTFAGLYDDWVGGSKIVDENGYSIISVTAPLTLYAHWLPLAYTLEFDTSDENIGGVSYFGKLEPFALATDSPIPYAQFPLGEKNGYNFIGWFAGETQVSNGSAPLESARSLNQTYCASAKEGKIVLTPRYSEIEYTVTFDLNHPEAAFAGDDGIRTYSYFNTGIPEEDYPLLSETVTGGKEFVGWSVVAYRLTPFTGTVAGDTTLYAIWKSFKTVSLDYGKGKTEEIKVYEGDGALTPEKNGYEFVAAYSDPSFGGGTRVTLDYTYLQDGKTYYLQFEAVEYTVRFVSNCDTSVAAISYTIEEEKALPLTPEKEHYTFVGWCAEEDLSDTPVTKIPAGNFGDKTFYAKFEGKKISVAFVSEYASESSKSVRYGEVPEATVPANGACPETKAFYGWYDAAEGGNRLSDENGVFTETFLRDEEGVTFYAHYKNIYHITLKGSIAAIAYCEPALKTFYFEGEAFSARLLLHHEGGYRILSLTQNGESIELTNDSVILRCEEITEDIEYAVTLEANEFTVNLNYPEEGWCKEDSATLTYGESFALPVPLLSGKKFTGWKTAAGGSFLTDDAGNSVHPWSIAKETELTACFEDSDESFEIIKDEASFLKMYANPSATYYLTNDITVSASGNQTRNEKAVTFSGTLYGNGFTISGLTGGYGLFYAVKGTVRDLVLNVELVSTGKEFGGLACVLAGGTVQNVTVNGSLSAGVDTDMGGVIGVITNGKGTLKGCSNNATLTGKGSNHCVGGVVGWVNASDAVIENCENNGTVKGTARWTGGVVGVTYVAVTLKNLTNRGEVSGTDTVGGIIGGTSQNGKATIDNCLSAGKVTKNGTRASKYCGSGSVVYSNIKPIFVKTAQDLFDMESNVAAETYILQNDIDLTGLNWTPFAFAGTFKGEKHEIKNLTCTVTDNSGGGLFSSLTGTVCDLILTVNITVESTSEVGGVAGIARGATIENVTVNGSIRSNVTGVLNVGGIVGFVNGQTSKIIGCENNATVTGSGNSSGGTAGGIAGYIYKTEGFVIENCENNGKVSGTAHYTGGIAGASENNFTIKNTTNRGEVAGSIFAGGIVGGAKVGTVTIDRCLSAGKVTVKGATGNKYIGSGKANFVNLKPIPVATANDLVEMANNDAVETYYLENDIDMEGVEWTPFALSAVLDGKDYKIKNLSFTVTSNAGGGVFTSVTGTVKNITFENLNAVYDYTDYSITSHTAYLKAGGIVPVLAKGTLQNVKVSGEVTAKGPFVKLGGLVGEMTGGAVTNCENSAAVTAEEGDAYVGGFIGFMTGGTCEDSTNHGNISGGGVTVNGTSGGVAGYASGASIVLAQLKNYGNVSCGTIGGGIVGNTSVILSSAENYGDVSGKESVGGIVGHMDRQGTYSMTGYINHGNITATGECAGGIFGRFTNITSSYSNTYTLTLSNFTNSGNVSGKIDVGGIFGYLRHFNNDNGNALLSASGLTNTGNVTATEKNAGGLFGSGHIESTSSVVKDSVSSGEITAPYVVGGLAGYISHVTIADCSNAGSKVTATGYETDGTNYNAYLGGYVGSGLNFCSFSGCENAAEIVYEERGRFVGGIAGYAKGSFTGCTNTADITAEKSAYVGGIAGYEAFYGTHTDAGLTNSGNITGLTCVGGIFGDIHNITSSYRDTSTTTLQKLTNSGNIAASGDFAGGIVGQICVNNTDNASYILTASNFTNTGNVTAKSHAGGLIGYATAESNTSKLSNSSSSGAITGEYVVGGLAGQLTNIALADCSNTGAQISATGYLTDGTSYNAYVGGYVGYGYSGNNLENAAEITYAERGRFVGGVMGRTLGALSGCTNTADITAERSAYVGGIAGDIACTWTYTCNGLTNSGNVAGFDRVGGIFGSLENVIASYRETPTTTLQRLTNSGNITAEVDYVGGLVGYAYVNNTDNASAILTAINLTNTGDVNGNSRIGGIFGYACAESADSRLSGSSSSGAVTGKFLVGGLAGDLTRIQMLDSSNAGATVTATGYDISNTEYNCCVGGYAGRGYLADGLENAVDLTYTERGRFVGGIMGRADGTLTNCTNTADITAEKSDYVGGLAGFVSSNGTYTIANLKNEGSVKGANRVGGVFGELNNTASSYSTTYVTTLNRLANSGAVTASGNYVGGIMGRLYANNGDRGGSYATATLLTNTGAVTGKQYVGGLFGQFHTESASTVVDYTQTGTVTGENGVPAEECGAAAPYAGLLCGAVNHFNG